MEPIILYEDNHIIVCYKEKGILSQADNTQSLDMLTILKSYIKEKYQKPGNVYLGLVHRLDRNTDGVMIFAKTSKAASRLSLDIKNNNFHKSYLAIVEGNLSGKKTLKDMLYYDEKNKKAYIKNTKDSKEAILEYEVLASKNNMSLLKINLKTGRHHQIRCQLSNVGHPIVGDIKYGSHIQMGNSYLLTAYELTFMHPTKKQKMTFKYLPNDKYFDDFKTNRLLK